MIKFLISLLCLIPLLAIGETNLPHIEIKNLDKTDRINLVSIYKDFLVNLENIESIEENTEYSFNRTLKKLTDTFTTYAGTGGDCIYAGWPSQRAANGFCERPENIEAYGRFKNLTQSLGFTSGSPVGFEECSADERMCNPVVFGPVCAPFNSKYNRVRATSNCDRASREIFPDGFDYASYLKENSTQEQQEQLKPWFEAQFSDLQGTAEAVCADATKKQSRTAVCKVLEQKLGMDFPYHSRPVNEEAEDAESSSDENYNLVAPEKSVKKNKSQKKESVSINQKKGGKVKNTQPVSETGLRNLEYKIQELNLGIENLLKSKACTDPTVAKVVNKTYNTIQLVDPNSGEFLSKEGSDCLKKLKPLLANRTKLLNEYEKTFTDLKTNGCDDGTPENKNGIIKQANDINSIIAEKVCEENPQKWTAGGCGKAFACAIGSSLFYGGPLDKVGAIVGRKLGFGKNCLNSQNNCLAKIASAAANVIWSFLKSLPALAGMAWDGIKWVGNKVYSWMPWVTETEKKMSDAGHAAMNSLGENEESTLTKIGNFFSNMWQMLKEYVTDDLMCTEPGWETERFKDKAHCDQPFVSWKCLTCAGAISGICNVVGAVGSEFLIGLLTGGAGNVVKSGVRSLSLGVKIGARTLLKKQMTTLAGKIAQQTVKTVVKTARVIKTPVVLAASVQRKSGQFLRAQGTKFASAQAWVSRNVNKITTPIANRSRVLGNVAELSIEGTGKAVKYVASATKTVVTAPFKLPGGAIKLVGRVMDPFKLGEKGFALGYQAANGLIPMANFLRITEFGYDMANITSDISKAANASKAVDASIDLMNLGTKQMDDWIRAANKGELTQTEFNQMQEMLAAIKGTKTKYAANPNALERLNHAELQYLEKEKQLKELLGQGSIKRHIAYTGKNYSGLEKGKIRNLKTGAESKIESVDVLRKNSGDVVLRTKPNDELLLVVDEVDGQFVAYTKSGEQVLVSSGNFSKDANKLIHSKLKAISDETRFGDAQDLFKKGSAPKINQRVSEVENSNELLSKSYIETMKDKVVSPVKTRMDRSALQTQISKGKNTERFTENAQMQASMSQQLVKVKDDLLAMARRVEKKGDLAALSKEMKILDDAKEVASPSVKLEVQRYQDEILKSLKNDEARNQLANFNRGPSESGIFGDASTNNVSIYSHETSGAEFKLAYDAKVKAKVDETGAYIRLDKNNTSEGLRIVDESENSFIGHNADGEVMHVKKTAVDEKLRIQISESVSKINPAKKQEILNKVKNTQNNIVYPVRDPDFKYSLQLAKSEVRVGDDIVRLRKWQAGSVNIQENLVDGGAVGLKTSTGNSLKINNIHESGDYWIGFSVPEGKKVLLPKYLLDTQRNNLMARGRNFTKFKRSVKEKLSFITSFNKKTKKIDVDKAFKAKYKFLNYSIKYNMSKEAFAKLETSTLQKISDKVYLRMISAEDAEVINLDENPISQEEQELQDQALEEAVKSNQDYDFSNINDNDLDF